MTKVENLAEKHLVVDSIEVLHDITGKGMTKIEGKVNLLTQSVSTVSKAQQQYIRDITADNIIDITEKRALKSSYNQSEITHAALRKEATSKKIMDTLDYKLYEEAYKEWHDYLNVELKVFDNMSENTHVPDTDKYIKLYNKYITQETAIQMIITSGKDGKIKLLNNIYDTDGYEENDVALYEGVFFRFENGMWKAISDTSGYLGVWSSMPLGNIDSYFLVADNFEARAVLYTHKGKLATTKDEKIGIFGKQKFKKVLFIKEHYKAGFLLMMKKIGDIQSLFRI